MKNETKKLSVLRVLLSITETSAPYNQFSLALAHRQDITICTYFQTIIKVSKKVRVFEGNNTVFGFIRVLRAAINNYQYDVIHAHTPHVGFLLILVLLFNNPKLFLFTVYTIHSSYPNYKFRNRLMLVWVFLFFHRIVCCSHASYASFPPFFKWLAGSRLQVIPNGVDIKRIDHSIRRTLSLDKPQDFTVVTIGRLIDLKQPHVLLQAFHKSRVSKKHLIYIGEGHLHQSLVAQSKQLGVEKNVTFTGLIPRDDVFQYLHKADLFVSTSRIEGLPVAVLEAMVCRCPVVLSDIPPHREIVGEADFIPLISSNDVDGFAYSIRRYQEMPTGERLVIEENCRSLIEERFSLSEMLEKYEQIYLELANGNA